MLLNAVSWPHSLAEWHFLFLSLGKDEASDKSAVAPNTGGWAAWYLKAQYWALSKPDGHKATLEHLQVMLA